MRTNRCLGERTIHGVKIRKRRKGGGRKRGPNGSFRHEKRAKLRGIEPLLITTSLVNRLPDMRNPRTLQVLAECFEKGCERPGFRMLHFSVQGDHLHFIVEGNNRDELTRGMKGLLVRIARALNKLWRRKGKVFAHRFHERILRKASSVRRAVRYVLNNARKHGRWFGPGPDPYSSGMWFQRWLEGPITPYTSGPTASHQSFMMEIFLVMAIKISVTDIPGRRRN